MYEMTEEIGNGKKSQTSRGIT